MEVQPQYFTQMVDDIRLKTNARIYLFQLMLESYSDLKAVLRRRGDRESSERCPGSGAPVTATDDEHEDMLIDLMGESRSWTVDQLAAEMVGAAFLPHELDDKQKENRSWLRCYDPLTDQQAQEWRQPGEDPAILMFFIASKNPLKENALQQEIN
ncbi:unnamed protein product [Oppiella nova]|uniref:Uncharacterized protein n=1 Tax=Oppiella nova TaxID=334625 RepID=A0A7R9MCY3_9ACAR|nr:unnamed protein product [Oppiella nova]CAG2174946.1 unnamed protein product [Oppiella nova]